MILSSKPDSYSRTVVWSFLCIILILFEHALKLGANLSRWFELGAEMQMAHLLLPLGHISNTFEIRVCFTNLYVIL